MRSRILSVIFAQALSAVFLAISPISCLFAQQHDSVRDLYAFTPADIAFLSSFSLSSLPPPPMSSSNKYADNLEIARFGKTLFFDARLSKGEKFSCASCHKPENYFTDGLALAQAHGTTSRSTPTLLGAAWSPWQYWDGRKDSLWSQALAPIEHPLEMGLNRASFVNALLQYHGERYQLLFGIESNFTQLQELAKNASPLGNSDETRHWKNLSSELRQQINRIFVNAGKALMAYQRQLRLPLSRFDHFVNALNTANENATETALPPAIFTNTEVKGLRLFMGKANCASCHNGPLFTNFEFHNIGAPETNPEIVDLGRYTGVKNLLNDEFTCLSAWSDAKPNECAEMRFLKRSGAELVGAFKTPTLRNIAQTGPYMQAGQFDNLGAVVSHYNLPIPPYYDREQHPNRPHFDILPLQLNESEIADIIAFLSTLTSPVPQDDFWWQQ